MLVAIDEIGFGGFEVGRLEEDVFDDVLDLFDGGDGGLDGGLGVEDDELGEDLGGGGGELLGGLAGFGDGGGDFLGLEGDDFAVSFFDLGEGLGLGLVGHGFSFFLGVVLLCRGMRKIGCICGVCQLFLMGLGEVREDGDRPMCNRDNWIVLVRLHGFRTE